MQLTLRKEMLDDVVVFHCAGRLVVGDEIRALQQQVEPHSRQCRRVILELAEVSFMDSAGAGALVRLFGVLRSHGCELCLCRLSPFVERVLKITNLLTVLPNYASEHEAIRASKDNAPSSANAFPSARTKIVCADTSHDVLAYLSALLERSGFDVLTTRHPSDAVTLIKVTGPRLLICGPGMQANAGGMEKLRAGCADVRLMLLPIDFSTAEAGEAGTNLVEQVKSQISAK